MQLRIIMRKLHIYLGLILAVQLLLWFVSGIYMSWMPLNKVHGDHLVTKPENKTFTAANWQPLAPLLNTTPLKSLQVIQLRQQPLLLITQGDGQRLLLDPVSGRRISLSESDIRQLAMAYYQGTGSLSRLELLTQLPAEARGRQLPLWRADFDDSLNTSLYLDGITGRLSAVRSDIWRLFDFLWMLHIMDYDEREDFNNPLLQVTAFTALLFTLSGFYLLYIWLQQKRQQARLRRLQKARRQQPGN